MDKSSGKFIITNEEGKELECEVLFTFDSDEFHKSYIIFTDNSKDENGNIRVYANTYDPSMEKLDLGKIETDKEWDAIDNILSSLQDKIEDEDGQKE